MNQDLTFKRRTGLQRVPFVQLEINRFFKMIIMIMIIIIMII